jgi:hypothetical protein
VAQKLLDRLAMRTPHVATDPWGSDLDNGWKDLVVSSAPPPPGPPPPPLSALREPPDSGVRNRALPADLNTWQEHGARAANVPAPVDEPSFSASDRRLWLVAGTLMGLAVLVLAVLGMLTFNRAPAPNEAAAAPTTASAESTRVATVEHARAVAPSRASAHAALAAATKSSANPRHLKTSSRTTRSRHHKRLAAR